MSIYTALITPFDREGNLDEAGLRTLIEMQVQAGIDGVLALATTGETATLTGKEKERVLAIAAEYRSVLDLVVGCGTNCTRTTLETIEWAVERGASSALVIAPYYNRPPEAGLRAHFQEIAHHTPCPIFLYNHPGRTGVTLSPSLVEHLASFSSVRGLKDSGELIPLLDMISHIKRFRPDFMILAGDELTALAALAAGADGLASISANIIPEHMAAFAHEGLHKAQELHRQLWPFWRALFSDTNPIPIKAAAQLLGLPAGEPRLPLVSLEFSKRSFLEQCLQSVLCLPTYTQTI